MTPKFYIYFVAALTLGALHVNAGAAAQGRRPAAPRKPSEAFERATGPVRQLQASGNFNREAVQKALDEQRRLALRYAALFNYRRWSSEELFQLGRLYALAGRQPDAGAAFAAYLAGPHAPNAGQARQGLFKSLMAQKKFAEAAPVAESLVAGQPGAEIWSLAAALAGELAGKEPERAAALFRNLLPGFLGYIDKLAGDDAAAGLAEKSLGELLRPAEVSRHAGDVSGSDTFLRSFAEALASAPLANREKVRRLAGDVVGRIKITGSASPPIFEGEPIGSDAPAGLHLKGKVVVVDFFAHWCTPCVAAIPKLNALQEKYGARGFAVVGVTTYFGYFEDRENLGPAEELEGLKGFIKQRGAKYGFVVSPRANESKFGEAGAAYHVTAVPAVAVLDRRGRVRFFQQGAVIGEQVERLIRSLLAEPAPRE